MVPDYGIVVNMKAVPGAVPEVAQGCAVLDAQLRLTRYW